MPEWNIFCKTLPFASLPLHSLPFNRLLVPSLAFLFHPLYSFPFYPSSHYLFFTSPTSHFIPVLFPLPCRTSLNKVNDRRDFRFPPAQTILLTSCKPSWDYKSQAGYQLFLICAMYMLPCLLMGFTYTQIARTLWSNAIPTESSKYTQILTRHSYFHWRQIFSHTT